MKASLAILSWFAVVTCSVRPAQAAQQAGSTASESVPSSQSLTLGRESNWLLIKAPHLPGGMIRINYLEAYCRAGSTDTDWVQDTVIKHRCDVLSVAADAKQLQLRDV